MDKDKIIVGGIYECKIKIECHKGIYTQATVSDLTGLEAYGKKYVHAILSGSGMTVQSIYIDQLDKQIGYDAYHSTEYNELSARIKEIQQAISAGETIVNYEEKNNPNSPLIKRDVQQAIRIYKRQLESVQSKREQYVSDTSWMGSEGQT